MNFAAMRANARKKASLQLPTVAWAWCRGWRIPHIRRRSSSRPCARQALLSGRNCFCNNFLPMCGRYRRTTSEEEIARQNHIPTPPQLDLPISYNIAPTQNVLAIRRNPETGERSLDVLRWGLIPNWAKDEKVAYKTINARSGDLGSALYL